MTDTGSDGVVCLGINTVKFVQGHSQIQLRVSSANNLTPFKLSYINNNEEMSSLRAL